VYATEGALDCSRMRRLVTYFVRGLAFVAPIAITVYVCVRIFYAFSLIDQFLRFSIPGLGLVLTLVVITLVGFLGSTLLARGLLTAVDSAIARLPFVRLLYSSTKDLMNAFVGEKRRFDTPVLVPAPGASGAAKAVGFVTQESLSRFGLADHVAVYLPFSYSLSGRLVIYPTADVVRLTTTSAEAMAFVVSGGVTESPRGV
jgi:uncharacterized membrane protein